MKYVLLASAIVLAACGGDEPPPEAKKPEGRAETRSIRNTEAVGYSGKAIADKVDDALDKNDRNVKRTEEQSTEPPSE